MSSLRNPVAHLQIRLKVEAIALVNTKHIVCINGFFQSQTDFHRKRLGKQNKSLTIDFDFTVPTLEM